VAITDPTFIGQIASVSGGIVRVRLREDMPTTLVMVHGESYRVGQIGAFFRIPLGYTQLYAVCTQVGADAAPPNTEDGARGGALEAPASDRLAGYRWMTIALFGESIGAQFERGVGQYPTVGDEVHIVTNDDLQVIYGWARSRKGTVPVGTIAAASGISADLNVAGLVSRHCAVVGSTGAGKSNLVSVLLNSIASEEFPSARVIVIDPHGEYSSALGDKAHVFRLRPNEEAGEKPLRVPFWALPFDELQLMTLGGLQPNHEAAVREQVLDLKTSSAALLKTQPPEETLTADIPVPFSIKRLWYELDQVERKTFRTTGANQKEEEAYPAERTGSADTLTPDRYPIASPYNQAPYKNQRKRNIERQLDLMRTRLRDGRFAFLFRPGGGYEPALDGRITSDLDSLVRDWVGHERQVTVFDVSGLPAEILSTIVGTMLRVVYDMLFWAQELPVGGRQQPLLIVIDEAHRFLPEGGDTPAHRTLSTIAKEGRKYGVGLILVTQRPSEIDSAVLSQCGSMIALRTTNTADRSKILAALPDDLGGLADLLPSLRTGEGLFLGEAMAIPSRVRVHKAKKKPIGDDPKLPEAWQASDRPAADIYTQALKNWRAQSTSSDAQQVPGQNAEGNDA
jgi:DNA helicase HerA-like ATPase